MNEQPTPRPLFTDGFNSAVHVTLGYLAGRCWWAFGLFALYQYVLKPDYNSTVDTAEYVIGMMARDLGKG